jgi:hypothetical protein
VIYIRLSTWLAMATLYLGFSMVMGYLIRRARTHPGSFWAVALVGLHAGALYVPGSILVLGTTNSPLALRLSVMLTGFILLALAAEQPAWLPPSLLRTSFLYRYFAVSMLFACVWGLSIAVTSGAFPALIIAMCAAAAGTASLTAPGRAT